jgi:glycosidase
MLVSRNARDFYQFDVDLFRPDGHLNLVDYNSARRFAAKISAKRSESVPASAIFAMSLLDEVYRILMTKYVLQNPGVMSRAADQLKSRFRDKLNDLIVKFVDVFPPVKVYSYELTLVQYHAAVQNFHPDQGGFYRQFLEDLLLVRNANENPAIQPYQDLFDETALLQSSVYHELAGELFTFFSNQTSVLGSQSASLTQILRSPAEASPNSLEGQLKYSIDKWGYLLDESIIQRLLRAMDFIREDIVRKRGPVGFHPEISVPTYHGDLEYERYSQDRDWMPRLVLIAKNTYVWLEQLSRKYQRWIRTLDQIPDDELDLLASRGFTGLWLIGLWERSPASQRIKQRMGDVDAVASAYSLHSYDIATDLGGWGSLNSLRAQAWQRGIRLSADMVPNHMGIDSTWVIEHPDWFLSLPYSPYPSYSFNSENLSTDARVGIYLEDHYYNHSDAAVVFQRRDQWTGDARYIYHGNDGTAFPWNDTAQLDYSNHEVREAVIQTILSVAHNFPIIRFDAAMTLTRKHIQRLWFPEPGAGGVIPSRAEHGMTRDEFDAKLPNEFWREVVDRVTAEVPDTLLLAEAFWLMEGYFVRTLGMHRVYNSAFMHMLRDEENAKYRQLIKNTLEFDPEILKRYVNFMNNPDEKTAIEQFGNGDKYFGICTLLATLPGLPMFGHGQVEGFHEKYGMEFRKPKLDEAPDEGLMRGHEWRIFPLLHQRYLFAEVDAFQLFDFFTADGRVNEDVIAYSNRFNDQRGLVIYHNKFGDTRGWINISAAKLDKGSGQLARISVGKALSLPHEGYAIFRDYVSHLEYIRPCSELWEKGVFAELGAYRCHVFMDWRFVNEDGGRWTEIYLTLGGAGVESVLAKYDEMFGVKEELGSDNRRVERLAKQRVMRKKVVVEKGREEKNKITVHKRHITGVKTVIEKPKKAKGKSAAAVETRSNKSSAIRAKRKKPSDKRDPAKSSLTVGKTNGSTG